MISYADRSHLVDVTEIFNQLPWEKKIRLYKLGYLVILLAFSIFWYGISDKLLILISETTCKQSYVVSFGSCAILFVILGWFGALWTNEVWRICCFRWGYVPPPHIWLWNYIEKLAKSLSWCLFNLSIVRFFSYN